MTESNTSKSNSRPLSTVASNFSAALDDLFQLGAIGELQDSLEEKNRRVESQKSQLKDLTARLRHVDANLKRLELKHKRMSRNFPGASSHKVLSNFSNPSDTDDTSASSFPSEHLEASRA